MIERIEKVMKQERRGMISLEEMESHIARIINEEKIERVVNEIVSLVNSLETNHMEEEK